MALSPPSVLALVYALLIAAGTGLLRLPAATVEPIGWGDALFTATSAVTITGLAVLDTGSGFTALGQGIILTLIQLGGLGIMVFAVLVLSMLGLPIGVSNRIFLREDLSQTSVSDILVLVKVILRLVLSCELAGAALLATVFVPGSGLATGFWQALFHSVSAFNNAGFSLFSDSLSRWAADPVINLAVPALFIVGGLGFSVVMELVRTRRWRGLSLHSKLMLAGTVVLILWSVALFAALEWRNPATLGGFDSTSARLLASWFQGVTTRSAGFTTLDIAGTRDSTSLMMMALMVIGGGSTSTAGGIKVTTFVVLILATIAFFRRRERPSAFGRSLGEAEVRKVLALATVSLIAVMSGIFLLTLSHQGAFLDLAFEVTSAFGTAGLSRGITGDLDALGRGVLIALMFLGRVGPLMLGFFLATPVPARVRYPAGQVFLG